MARTTSRIRVSVPDDGRAHVGTNCLERTHRSVLDRRGREREYSHRVGESVRAWTRPRRSDNRRDTRWLGRRAAYVSACPMTVVPTWARIVSSEPIVRCSTAVVANANIRTEWENRFERGHGRGDRIIVETPDGSDDEPHTCQRAR